MDMQAGAASEPISKMYDGDTAARFTEVEAERRVTYYCGFFRSRQSSKQKREIRDWIKLGQIS
jgi:hypothetical protein